MTRRASTDYSFVVGIDKPTGMTSHDVVNALRRIYGERRVGHTGTLDPAASGVLLMCVGPATRLDQYISGHDKIYEFTCVFGAQTATDDAEGEVIEQGLIPSAVYDKAQARKLLSCFLGPSQQLPPAYSAIKVGGVKAYQAARQGKEINLLPRDIVVHSIELVDIEGVDTRRPAWRVQAHVSSGTYIRSLARDIGHAMNTYAHVGSLRRLQAGNVKLEACVSLETLQEHPYAYMLDPVRILGTRMAFVRENEAASVLAGAPLVASVLPLFSYSQPYEMHTDACVCTIGALPSKEALKPNELIAMIIDAKLVALYRFDELSNTLKSACGFSKGVVRGGSI